VFKPWMYPNKAYIKSAKTYKDFKNAKNYGITVLENSVFNKS